jgi:hypothetical protein
LEIATMSEIGRWVATWDRVTSRKKSTVVFPGWRVAWECDGFENIWTDMTFGRAEDAARAVKALYTLDDWQCASLEEARATTMRITRAKMRQTILEAMAW